MDEDGWIHTGDIGALLPNGALKIIDRKKNIFKLQQGEYIAPDKLENGYGLIPVIKQIFVYGDSLQGHLVSIVVPEPGEVKKWAEANGHDCSDMAAFITTDLFKNFVLDEMKRVQKEKNFNGMEIPKSVFCTLQEFTVENDTLTPSFKLKRNEAKIMYLKEIKEQYGGAKL